MLLPYKGSEEHPGSPKRMEYTTAGEMHRKSSATLNPTINKIILVFWLKKKPQTDTWHTGVSQGLLCGMNEGLHEIYIQIPPSQ